MLRAAVNTAIQQKALKVNLHLDVIEKHHSEGAALKFKQSAKLNESDISGFLGYTEFRKTGIVPQTTMTNLEEQLEKELIEKLEKSKPKFEGGLDKVLVQVDSEAEKLQDAVQHNEMFDKEDDELSSVEEERSDDMKVINKDSSDDD